MREARIESFACSTIWRCLNSSSMQFLLSWSECGALRFMNEISNVVVVVVVLPMELLNLFMELLSASETEKCFLNLIFGKLISRRMPAVMKFHFAMSQLRKAARTWWHGSAWQTLRRINGVAVFSEASLLSTQRTTLYSPRMPFLCVCENCYVNA